MKKLPKTKILATIGPATWSDEVLKEMIKNGFSLARINASFADFSEQERVVNQIRGLSPKVGIILDTMGHKIRVTGFTKDKIIITGKQITLVSEGKRSNTRGVIKVTYPSLEKDVTRGTDILIDDGNIHLRVLDIRRNNVLCEIIQGGILKPRKTVNIPGTHLNFPKLSHKDEEDIKNGVKLGCDYISASFVRNVEDVQLVRDTMGDTEVRLIAKIEDYEGVQNFDAILEVVDAIMIARGDLGVELPVEQVPILQKQFIRKCRIAGKPVIVATQMLESMRENPRPTRAEVSDVANAVMDGTDCLMLSAETSTGKHPVESVKFMAKIAIEAEAVLQSEIIEGRTSANEVTDSVCRHLFGISKEVEIAGAIILSTTGKTVTSLARHRPNMPIWCVSDNPALVRQLQLVRGVTGIYVKEIDNDRDGVVAQAVSTVYGKGHLEISDRVAIISGSKTHKGRYNTALEIVEVKSVI